VSPPPEPWPSITAAIDSGDATTLREVLARHPEVRARLNAPLPGGPFGMTPLLVAVQRRHRPIIEALLDAGADINARSHWWAGGFGVLDHEGDRELSDWLIGRGARVDAHAAARLGMVDRLRALHAADPSLVRARGGDGQTPLHFARDVATAQCLLDHGADPDARDIDHESTPAQWMIRDRREVARFLVSRGCRTDLLLAAALGDAPLARRHLAENPDSIRLAVRPKYFPMTHPHAGGSIYIWTLGADKTAPMVARDFGHRDLERELLDLTPPPLRLALAGQQGDTAEFHALLAAHPGLVAELTDEEKSRIADAAKSGNTAAVTLMADAGWPLDARGQHGGTPLHWAAFHGDAAMVNALLARRAPLEIMDHDFHATPLGWATHGSVNGWRKNTGDYPGVVDALLTAGAALPEDDAGTPAVREILRKARSKS
jgi:ankyrin repeat protein